MSYGGHDQAEVDPSNPRAFARCDRCFCLTNHFKLQWQFRYAGPTLTNTGLLVCKTCLDVPNPQEKTLVLGPDPLPIRNPRPTASNLTTDYLVTSDGFYIDDDLDNDFVIGGENG